MEMRSIVNIAALMVVIGGTSASDFYCYVHDKRNLHCRDLFVPPPGFWPEITALNLRGSQLSRLHKHSLTGFPALENLILPFNNFTDVDFGELATVANLSSLDINFNEIRTFTSPPNGTILERLTIIYAPDNQISHLNPDLHLFAPNLRILDIRNNPLTLQPGQPILNHLKLESLRTGSGRSQFKVIDSTLLSGLPNLKSVVLAFAKTTSVEGAFANNELLEEAHLFGNNITQISPGTFASKGLIRDLDLERNPLRTLDIAALNNTMSPGGRININRTPLACECGYEALYRWATPRNITIHAYCPDHPECAFTRSS